MRHITRMQVVNIMNAASKYATEVEKVEQRFGIGRVMNFPSDADTALTALSEIRESLEFIELERLLESLSKEQLAEFLAVMWIGRGDYGAEDWDGIVEEATRSIDDGTVQYIIEKAPLPEYLRDGLEELPA